MIFPLNLFTVLYVCGEKSYVGLFCNKEKSSEDFPFSFMWVFFFSWHTTKWDSSEFSELIQLIKIILSQKAFFMFPWSKKKDFNLFCVCKKKCANSRIFQESRCSEKAYMGYYSLPKAQFSLEFRNGFTEGRIWWWFCEKNQLGKLSLHKSNSKIFSAYSCVSSLTFISNSLRRREYHLFRVMKHLRSSSKLHCESFRIGAKWER